MAARSNIVLRYRDNGGHRCGFLRLSAFFGGPIVDLETRGLTRFAKSDCNDVVETDRSEEGHPGMEASRWKTNPLAGTWRVT